MPSIPPRINQQFNILSDRKIEAKQFHNNVYNPSVSYLKNEKNLSTIGLNTCQVQ